MTKNMKECNSNARCRENAIYDLNKVVKRFCPDLFKMFGRNMQYDKRVQSFVVFSMGFLLTIMFYKIAGSIVSMHGLNKLNFSNAIINMMKLSGQQSIFLKGMPGDRLPTFKAINDFMSKLDPQHLESIRTVIIFRLIRSNNFYNYRLRDMWIIIVDGTQIYSGKRKMNLKCLFRIHNKGKENEYTSYHIQVLEAKLYLLGTNLAFSIMTEFIENTPESEYGNTPISDQKYKQDCELKAFIRLAERLKKYFKRLPICITADALYNCVTAMEICEKNGWSYIFRYKDGSIPYIAEEVEALKDHMVKVNVATNLPFTDVAYLNEIDYKGHKVSYIRATDKEVEKPRDKRGRKKTATSGDPVVFQWITNLAIKSSYAVQIITAGRARWTIENEGFNRQKNWSFDITHLCSWNETAIKNHYLMVQIVEIFRMLFEFYTYDNKNIARSYSQIAEDIIYGLTSFLLFETIDPEKKEIMEQLKCVNQ